MTIRETLYEALSGSSEIQAIVDDRVFSQYETVPAAPFLVIRLSNSLAERPIPAEKGFIHIWAHDVPGDYTIIDQLLKEARLVLEALPNEGELIQIVWLECSSDLPLDPETGVIAKYARFQHTSLL